MRRLKIPQKELNSQKDLVHQISDTIFPHTPKLLPTLPKTSDTAFASSSPHSLLCFYPSYIPIHTNVLFQHLPAPCKFHIGLLFLHVLEALNILSGKIASLLSHPLGTSDYHLKLEGYIPVAVWLCLFSDGSPISCFSICTGRLALILQGVQGYFFSMKS